MTALTVDYLAPVAPIYRRGPQRARQRPQVPMLRRVYSARGGLSRYMTYLQSRADDDGIVAEYIDDQARELDVCPRTIRKWRDEGVKRRVIYRLNTPSRPTRGTRGEPTRLLLAGSPGAHHRRAQWTEAHARRQRLDSLALATKARRFPRSIRGPLRASSSTSLSATGERPPSRGVAPLPVKSKIKSPSPEPRWDQTCTHGAPYMGRGCIECRGVRVGAPAADQPAQPGPSIRAQQAQRLKDAKHERARAIARELTASRGQ